ncbi:MAG: hypothetical protein CMP10_07990 [Zetaproteobacteria bacterium]|nr:hypothetical protein [Pseudobdellovibrionaceae bacterium]
MMKSILGILICFLSLNGLAGNNTLLLTNPNQLGQFTVISVDEVDFDGLAVELTDPGKELYLDQDDRTIILSRDIVVAEGVIAVPAEVVCGPYTVERIQVFFVKRGYSLGSHVIGASSISSASELETRYPGPWIKHNRSPVALRNHLRGNNTLLKIASDDINYSMVYGVDSRAWFWLGGQVNSYGSALVSVEGGETIRFYPNNEGTFLVGTSSDGRIVVLHRN